MAEEHTESEVFSNRKKSAGASAQMSFPLGTPNKRPSSAISFHPEKTLRTSVARDEMNLAEFPLTVLSTRVNSNVKTLEFSDTIFDKKGKPIKRSWIITAADKFGLPTSSDDEVLLGLLKLTVDQNLNGY